MNVLVTGADGFIGKRLCEFLSKGSFAVTRFKSDVTRPETFSAGHFDIVVYLASKITHCGSVSGEELRATNVDGVKNILAYYPDAKMVFVSTTDVTRECLTDYAKTKLDAEHLVEKNPNNLIVRLPSVFGPHQVQDKLIPRLLKHFYRGEPCEVTSDDLREYLFLDDACRAIVAYLGSVGLVTLVGISIRNFRLRELVESIFSHRILPALTPAEERFVNQLRACAEALPKK